MRDAIIMPDISLFIHVHIIFLILLFSDQKLYGISGGIENLDEENKRLENELDSLEQEIQESQVHLQKIFHIVTVSLKKHHVLSRQFIFY